MIKKDSNLTKIIYRLEAFGLNILEKLFSLLGLEVSSFIFGTIFMIFGPLTRPSFLAMKNIKKVMPELNFFQRFKIVLGMWNNLGRNLAEFTNVNSISFQKLSKNINIDDESIANLKKMKKNNSGGIIFTAHFGNWEVFSQVFSEFKIPFSAIYREMNNKFVDDIVLKYREKTGMDLIPKGQKGIMKLARNLKNGRKILMLVDQRLSNGIKVPFMGAPSMTTDSVATFALKHDYKVYSAVAFRRSFGCYFDIKIREFDVINTGNLEQDIRDTTIKVNQEIENWIKQKPEQWFWVHNRWK